MKINLSFKTYLFNLIGLFFLFTSCAPVRKLNVDIKDIQDNYYSEEKEVSGVCINIFFDERKKRRLNGLYRTSFSEFSTLSNYKRGKKNGNSKIFKNDTLIRETNYKNGIKNGKECLYTQYEYIDLYQIEVRNYENGLKNGKQYIYGFNSENDEIKVEILNYINGVKQGTEVEYVDNRLVRTVEFRNGMKIGKEEYYNTLSENSASANYNYYPDDKDNKLTNQEFNKYIPFGIMNDYKGTVHINAYTHLGPSNYIDGFSIGMESILWNAIDFENVNCGFNVPLFYYIFEYNYGSFDTLYQEKWIVFNSWRDPNHIEYIKIEK